MRPSFVSLLAGPLTQLPRSIWVLGCVSLVMDIASEMIHAVLPIYLVTVVGASVAMLGLIEGLAAAIAAIVRVFSGVLSDSLRHRKWVAAAGYGLSAASKPIFLFAASLSWLIAARWLDRLGKGMRGAPRDALIADLAPRQWHGTAYGLRQALDTLGALVGPLLAVGLMWLSNGDFHLVFGVAILPACGAFVLIAAAVPEPVRRQKQEPRRQRPPLFRATLWGLPRAFWAVLTVGTLLTLARFSEAFLVLRALETGLSPFLAPAVMAAMTLTYALGALPAGVLADRCDRRLLLCGGAAVLLGADLLLACASSLAALLGGVLLWGVHLALTQGLLAAMVAAVVDEERRGTAFGLFGLISGLALLAASLLAGAVWEVVGAGGTFLAGATLTAAAIAAQLSFWRITTAAARSAL